MLEAIHNFQQRERRFGGLGEGTDEHLEGKDDTLEAPETIAAEFTSR